MSFRHLLAFAALFALMNPAQAQVRTSMVAVPFSIDLSEVIKPVEAAPETILIDFGDEGMKLDGLLKLVQRLTGSSFSYDSRRIQSENYPIGLRGQVSIAKDELDTFFQSVFLSHGLVLNRLGGGDARVFELVHLQSSQFVKQNALHVSWEKIGDCAKRPAEIFACLVPLEYVDCRYMQRMLNNMIQEHRACFVHPLEDANAVMICGPGQLVTTFAESIRRAEQLAATERAKIWREKPQQGR